jgi:hypothetical protein
MVIEALKAARDFIENDRQALAESLTVNGEIVFEGDIDRGAMAEYANVLVVIDEALKAAGRSAPAPTDLAAAVECADARWSGVDVPVEWARHFADAIGKPYATPPAAPAQPVQEPVAWLYPEGLEALQNGKCWTAYPTKHDGCNIPLCAPPAQPAHVQEPLGALILGGVIDTSDGPEYEEWDVEWNTKAVEALQEKLVTSDSVTVMIYTTTPAQPEPVPLTADDIREPKNGKDWRVEWWNESCRMMLPSDMRLDAFRSYKNGTLQFTIKRRDANPPEKGQS